MDRPFETKHYVLAAMFICFHAFIALQAWRSRARVAAMHVLPTRSRHFAGTVVTQITLLAASLGVAFAFRLRLFPPVLPSAFDVLLGLAATAALVLLMRPRWEAAVRTGDRRLHFFMPSGAKEKAWWVGVSVAAGIGEEVTYRGVLYLLVLMLTGSAWIAVLLSALLFAGAHAFQSRLSMVIIFGFALVFQGLAIRSGSLYVPMLAHVLYDVAAGFTYSRLGKRLGFVAQGDPAGSNAAPAPISITSQERR
jgi:membrane protease YdiL (CAAX protease family)